MRGIVLLKQVYHRICSTHFIKNSFHFLHQSFENLLRDVSVFNHATCGGSAHSVIKLVLTPTRHRLFMSPESASCCYGNELSFIVRFFVVFNRCVCFVYVKTVSRCETNIFVVQCLYSKLRFTLLCWTYYHFFTNIFLYCLIVYFNFIKYVLY